jgi:tetratricopeptide (TPR) repeat protein
MVDATPQDELPSYDEIVRRFPDATRLQVANTLLGQAHGLMFRGRLQDAVSASDEVVRRFGDATEPEVRDVVAEALYFKIFTLAVEADLSVKISKLETLKRYQEVVAAYDELDHRFRDSTELHLRQILTGALFRKALALRQLGRHDEALAAFDEIVRRCGDSRQPDLRMLCDSALKMKSSMLDRLGRDR